MKQTSSKNMLWPLILTTALVIQGLLPQPAHGMYDPKHGRWLQRDPLGVREDAFEGHASFPAQYDDGANLYAYAKSRPTVGADPNGMEFILTEEKHMDCNNIGVSRGAVSDPFTMEEPRCVAVDMQPMGRLYQLQLREIRLSLTMQILREGHAKWGAHAVQYDKKWDDPRTNAREREAVIAHEYDHWRTMSDGFWPQIVRELEPYDGLLYCSKDACGQASRCLKQEVHSFWQKAQDHSNAFNQRIRNQGGMYDEFPFDEELDVVKCRTIGCQSSLGPCGMRFGML